MARIDLAIGVFGGVASDYTARLDVALAPLARQSAVAGIAVLLAGAVGIRAAIAVVDWDSGAFAIEADVELSARVAVIALRQKVGVFAARNRVAAVGCARVAVIATNRFNKATSGEALSRASARVVVVAGCAVWLIGGFAQALTGVARAQLATVCSSRTIDYRSRVRLALASHARVDAVAEVAVVPLLAVSIHLAIALVSAAYTFAAAAGIAHGAVVAVRARAARRLLGTDAGSITTGCCARISVIRATICAFADAGRTGAAAAAKGRAAAGCRIGHGNG